MRVNAYFDRLVHKFAFSMSRSDGGRVLGKDYDATSINSDVVLRWFCSSRCQRIRSRERHQLIGDDRFEDGDGQFIDVKNPYS
jgi:hypothetical protein